MPVGKISLKGFQQNSNCFKQNPGTVASAGKKDVFETFSTELESFYTTPGDRTQSKLVTISNSQTMKRRTNLEVI